MNNNEARFWRDTVLTQLHPGWTLALGDNARSGSIDLANSTAAIYLVDTSSNWRLAGLTRPADMLALEEQIRAGKIPVDRIMSAAGWAVAENAGQLLSQTEQEAARDAEYAVKVTVGALVQTQCYELAKQSQSGLSGHWLYLVYRMRDGSVIGRPAMLPMKPSPFPLLRPEALEGCVRHILQADASASVATSAIARRLHESGGPILADADTSSHTDRPRPPG